MKRTVEELKECLSFVEELHEKSNLIIRADVALDAKEYIETLEKKLEELTNVFRRNSVIDPCDYCVYSIDNYENLLKACEEVDNDCNECKARNVCKCRACLKVSTGVKSQYFEPDWGAITRVPNEVDNGKDG